MIIYLLEVSICMLVFTGIYRWLLDRNGIHRANRVYLLLAPVASALIPLFRWSREAGQFLPSLDFRSLPWIETTGARAFSHEFNQSAGPDFILTVGDLLLGLYGIGVLYLATVFLKSLLDTLQAIRQEQRSGFFLDERIQAGRLPAIPVFSTRYWRGDYMDGREKVLYSQLSRFFIPFYLLEVIIMEVVVILGWFLPMTWSLRKQLQAVHLSEADAFLANAFGGREEMIGYLVRENAVRKSSEQAIDPLVLRRIASLQGPSQGAANGWKHIASFVLVIPVLAGLLGLFGSGAAPVPIMDKSLQVFGKEIASIARKEVLHLDSENEEQVYMEWAGKEVPLIHIEKQTDVRFPFHVFTEPEFRKFQTQFPVIYRQDGKVVEIVKVRISITAGDHQNFYNLECPGSNMGCLHEAMEGMPASSSIQLVFTDPEQQQYYCILTDEKQTLYIPNRWYIEDPFIFDKPPALKSYGVEKMTRVSPRYEIIWGPELRFGLDHPETYPVTPGALGAALEVMPALTPIHGGVIDAFAFDLRYVGSGNDELKFRLTIDQSDPGAYRQHPYLNLIRENLAEGDILHIEKVRLTDGREIGRFSCLIVNDPHTFRQRKWNLANFNFSDGERSRFQNQLTEKPDAYVLKWGTFFIPLDLYASPDRFKAKLELETEQFRDLLEYPIEVYRNNEKLPSAEVPRSLQLVYLQSAELSIEPISGIQEEGEIRIRKQDFQGLAHLLRPGHHLSISGEIAGIRLDALEIEMFDLESPYRPSVHLPGYQASDEEYSFQVIQGVGKEKTVIKIDSASASAREILDMYRDDRKYEIVQIPGFRTTRRLVTPDIKAVGSSPALLGQEFLDIHQLKERVLGRSDRVMMEWGRMNASPVSGNYSTREFRYSGRWPLRLYLNSEVMDVRQMEVKLYSGEKLAHHFNVRQLSHPILQKAIQSIPSKGTVLITNIVVNEQGQALLFPQDFAFSVE